jgi:hypothetical protein
MVSVGEPPAGAVVGNTVMVSVGEPPAGAVVGTIVMVSVVVEVVESVVVDETDDEAAWIFYQDVSIQETPIRSFHGTYG